MLPAVIAPYAPLIIIVLVFLDGLFFGLAFKKGVTAFVFVVVAFAIADFIGLYFIPHIPMSAIISQAMLDLSLLHLGLITITATFIFFLVGIAIGVAKG